MADPIFLSIDIDFWAEQDDVDEAFIRRALDAADPKTRYAAIDHHSILPVLGAHADRCRTLVNIDTHSDLGGYSPLQRTYWPASARLRRKPNLDCGSWVDYACCGQLRRYIWIYPTPDARHIGRCDGGGDIDVFTPGTFATSDWPVVRAKLAASPKRNYGVSLEAVQAVCIVWSPEYCGPGHDLWFRRFVAQHKLPVIDGCRGQLTGTRVRIKSPRKPRRAVRRRRRR